MQRREEVLALAGGERAGMALKRACDDRGDATDQRSIMCGAGDGECSARGRRADALGKIENAEHRQSPMLKLLLSGVRDLKSA